jgi:hypothetical protein
LQVVVFSIRPGQKTFKFLKPKSYNAGQNPIILSTNENKKFNFIYKREEGDGLGGMFVIKMVQCCGDF